MLEKSRARLATLRRLPAETAQAAAPRIAEKLRQDATTKRGNVPSFGRMGNVPITAEVRAGGLSVRAPAWVLKKAFELGQVDEWTELVRATARELASK